ncbi:MAG: HAMP domain-containing histidine kinase [Pseudomonadota bacterium]|nr:HAMP domain-containing histidine kinase [Pseudomonadota bacterium]
MSADGVAGASDALAAENLRSDDRPSEAEKDRLIADLRAAVCARDDFLAVVSHELRNPLTPMVVLLEMLCAAAADPATPASPVVTRRLERLRLATDRYLRRVKLLLEVSRFTSGGGIRPDPTHFDLSVLIAEVVAAAAPSAALVRTAVETAIEPGIAGSWDRLGVEQVVDNLLSNAIKYGAGRPVTVSLSRNGDPPGGCVHLRVCDRGIGISAADQARIFERFERAVGRTEQGGFGVGLWVARQIARAMGGEIMVTSCPGKGSTFTLTLPLAGTRPLAGAPASGGEQHD